ncbi:MAG: hypothetical protein V1744_03510 [Candidatus Altiarchaeota archaeon]
MMRLAALVSILLVCGCICSQDQQEADETSCTSPYIRVGSDCCIDENDNMICDEDEPVTTLPYEETTTLPVEESTTLTEVTVTNPSENTIRSTTLTTRTTVTSTATTTSTTSSTTSTTLPIPCYDTDGGVDEYTTGTASRGAEISADKCRGTASLTEYYCAGNRVTSKIMDCPKGCVDGRCAGCVDSDGGVNPEEYGEVTLGTTLTKKDYCSKIGDAGNVLFEFYCKSVTEVGSEEVTCPGACSDGKCI